MYLRMSQASGLPSRTWEHTAAGILHTLDVWLYTGQSTRPRYRRTRWLHLQPSSTPVVLLGSKPPPPPSNPPTTTTLPIRHRHRQHHHLSC